MLLESINRWTIHAGTDTTALNSIQRSLIKTINVIAVFTGLLWVVASIPLYIWSGEESIPLVCMAAAALYFLILLLNENRKYLLAFSTLLGIDFISIAYFGALLLPGAGRALINILLVPAIIVASLYFARLFFRDKKQKLSSPKTIKEPSTSILDRLNEISHDYRVKLNGIHALTHELALQIEENAGPEVIQVKTEIINVLNSLSKSMLDLTNNVLDSAKLQAGKLLPKLAPIHLATWLHPLVQAYRVTSSVSGIELRLSVADQVPSVFVSDELFLSRILSNLLSNAIKFSPARGVVELIFEVDAHQLIIKIKDNGVGIEAPQLKSVFEYYNSGSNSPGGAGLGLAISKNMAENIGGSIAVESKPNIGSTFILKIPLWVADSLPTVDKLPVFRSLFGVKVLVLDDDKISHMVAAIQLKRLGCFSYFCNSSVKGLVLVGKIKPDIILCDLNMPGLSGAEFIKELRAMDHCNDIPVIIVSGETRHQYIENLPGANGFLIKPVTLEQLYYTIDSFLK